LEGVGCCIQSPCVYQIALHCLPHSSQQYLGRGDLAKSQVDGIASNIWPRSVLACNSKVCQVHYKAQVGQPGPSNSKVGFPGLICGCSCMFCIASSLRVGGVDSFFCMSWITLESNLRVSWKSLPGLIGGALDLWAGLLPVPSISWMVGSARKVLRCGPIPVFLDVGLYSFMHERSHQKAPFGSKTMGTFDMMAVSKMCPLSRVYMSIRWVNRPLNPSRKSGYLG
jgi:hypothetical protein